MEGAGPTNWWLIVTLMSDEEDKGGWEDGGLSSGCWPSAPKPCYLLLDNGAGLWDGLSSSRHHVKL